MSSRATSSSSTTCSAASVRSYFSAEPVPPDEEYREGNRIWKYSGMAQSFQFDVRDNATGEIIPFRELLGLLYYGCCKPDSDIYRIGEIAHENNDLDLRRDHLRDRRRDAGRPLSGEARAS